MEWADPHTSYINQFATVILHDFINTWVSAWWHVMWFLRKLWLHLISTCAQQNTPRKIPGQESRQMCISSGSERKKRDQVVTAALVPEKEGGRLADISGHRFWSQKHWIQDSFLPFIEQITTMLSRAILRINDIVLGKWLIHQKIIYKC